jgi:predicted metal-binding membrane protein
LAAVYCLGACFAVFMALFVIAHVARFVLFHAKTWNV